MNTGDELQIKFNQIVEITKIEFVKKQNIKQYLIKYVDENNDVINYKVRILNQRIKTHRKENL